MTPTPLTEREIRAQEREYARWMAGRDRPKRDAGKAKKEEECVS